MRWWIYVIVGCLAYLSTLITSVPIQHVAYQLTSSGLPLVIGQINGTIWQGEAARVSYQNIPLGPVSWRFVPLGLLQGQIEYAVELNDSDHTLGGYVARDLLSDGFSLSEIKGQLPADSLLKLSNQTDLNANGQLDVELQKLRISDRRITTVEGEIRWLDAGIERPFRAVLGNLQFNLSGDELAIKSEIKELDGPLQVNGELTLMPDGSYQLQGKVTPNDAADPGLISLLQSIGRPANDGSIQIDYSGRM
jgi:general secretion pathway protein N